MKVIKTVLIKLICVLFLCAPCFANDVPIDKVLVTIDGDPILKSEIVAFAQAKLNKKQVDFSSDEIRQFAQQYVADELLKRESSSLGIKVFDEEVKAYVDEIKRQNGIEDEQFNRLLLERGLTRDVYENQARMDILKSRIVSRQIRSTITISDQQITRYLDENPELKPAPGSVRILQVFVPMTYGRERAEEILAETAKGEGLQSAGGRFYSDIGYVDPENLRKELRDAVEKLEVSKRSSLVETDLGYYILEVASKVDKDGTVDGQVTEDIRNKLFEKEFEEKLANYLDTELPKKYLVEFK